MCVNVISYKCNQAFTRMEKEGRHFKTPDKNELSRNASRGGSCRNHGAVGGLPGRALAPLDLWWTDEERITDRGLQTPLTPLTSLYPGPPLSSALGSWQDQVLAHHPPELRPPPPAGLVRFPSYLVTFFRCPLCARDYAKLSRNTGISHVDT